MRFPGRFGCRTAGTRGRVNVLRSRSRFRGRVSGGLTRLSLELR